MADSKAVILDHSVMVDHDEEVTNGLRTLMCELRSHGVRLVGFSTHPINLNERLWRRSLPPVDLLLTRADVGQNKGATSWITRTSERLGLEAHKLCYLGDDDRDWRTAINSGILYLHAEWAAALPASVTALTVATPADAWTFLSHFFLPSARWEYTLDDPARELCVRSLLNASTTLQATAHSRFSLQDVFTYDRRPVVGTTPARDLLMMHAIANLYAEGLLCSGCRFAVYPGSTPGERNPTFTDFLAPAAKFFHGWLKEDLIVRAAQAHDTSILRRDSRGHEVTFTNQTNTVIISPDYQGKLAGKTVIVFDDFTTSGMSLDWARTLLRAAGVVRVVLVTFGKYAMNHPARHHCYTPRGFTVQPFALQVYQDIHFDCAEVALTRSIEGRTITAHMFEFWSRGEPFPVGQPAGVA